MITEGKCKEDFEKWYENVDKDFPNVRSRKEAVYFAWQAAWEYRDKETKELVEALGHVCDLSGMAMDYGSDSDTVQRIYIASLEALENHKRKAGE